MLLQIKFLRITGITEGISFLVLLLIAMPMKYYFAIPLAVKIVGWLHGGKLDPSLGHLGVCREEPALRKAPAHDVDTRILITVGFEETIKKLWRELVEAVAAEPVLGRRDQRSAADPQQPRDVV